MTPRFAARRRAEEFNSLVESTSPEELDAAPYAAALELVASLRETAPVEPRAEFVADLRRQLMTEAASVLTPTAARLTVTPRRNPRERRIALAIGGFAVVSATTSMAMAAQTALPGDTLYPFKRALENASTTIQIDEDAKGASLLSHASGRLDEVGELTRASDEPNTRAVTDTLHTFADQASSASDLMIAAYADTGEQADIEELRSFTAQSMTAIDHLETVVPEPARAALIEAAQVISAIDSQAIRLCPSCGDGGAQAPSFEPTSVRDLLVGLESALAPLTGPQPASSPGRDRPARGAAPQPGAEVPTQQPTAAGSPDKPADSPDPVPDRPAPTGGPTQGDGGGNAAGGGGSGNVIEDLTDRLTGGGRGDRTDHQGTLGAVLDDALGGIVKGLLGQ